MGGWVGGVIAAGHFLSPSCMQWCMYVCMNHGSLLCLVLLVCLDSEYVIDIFCLLLPLARVGVGVGCAQIALSAETGMFVLAVKADRMTILCL